MLGGERNHGCGHGGRGESRLQPRTDGLSNWGRGSLRSATPAISFLRPRWSPASSTFAEARRRQRPADGLGSRPAASRARSGADPSPRGPGFWPRARGLCSKFLCVLTTRPRCLPEALRRLQLEHAVDETMHPFKCRALSVVPSSTSKDQPLQRCFCPR